MESNSPKSNPASAEEFPKNSAPVGRVPNGSADFGTVPQSSEPFRELRNVAERKESHTMTVREAARLFERAGVARTERSIINWCQANRNGVARLDCYFDPNERKYFITPESVRLAIGEEQSKARKEGSQGNPQPAADIPKQPDRPAAEKRAAPEADPEDGRGLKQELMDLKITNRAKDMFIDQLKSEREGFAEERQEYVEKLMSFNHRVGQLETRLMQLEAPKKGVGTEPEAAERPVS
jgi:hypothetical protein